MVIAATLPYFKIPEAGLLLVLGVDHFLDMGRSATNVIGNSVASAVVAKWEGELGETVPASAPSPGSELEPYGFGDVVELAGAEVRRCRGRRSCVAGRSSRWSATSCRWRRRLRSICASGGVAAAAGRVTAGLADGDRRLMAGAA